MYKRSFAVMAFVIVLVFIGQAWAGEIMKLSVRSPAFTEGDRIPVKYTCDGEDVSPPLSWDPGPTATESYVLIVDDPDAKGGPFTHWLVYNIPYNVTRLSEHVTAVGRLDDGTLQGKNHFGRTGYGGPCPPPGESPHHYRFDAYALDTRLKLDPETVTKDDLIKAMMGHVLAQGELRGIYGR